MIVIHFSSVVGTVNHCPSREIILSTGLNGYKTFGQIVTCSNQLYILYNEAMYTDSTRQFVYASGLPKRMDTGFVTTLRTNELLIATHASSFSQWKVSKGSIRSEEGERDGKGLHREIP